MSEILFEKIQLFTLHSVAIFLEATPFLLLGALLSALFEVFAPDRFVSKLIPKHKHRAILTGAFMGFLIPTCECGVVPIARKFIQKGFPGYMVISYMISAPVVNPIVLISTYIAFRYNIWMVAGRAGIVLLIAICVGWMLSREKEDFLINNKEDNHSCSGEGCSCSHNHEPSKGENKLLIILRHISNDFMDMGAYLIIGCFAASGIKTFLPGDVLSIFEGSLILSIIAMMFLAVALSVCSEADAFVAASFTGFPLISQLSFVTIGPIVDLKLIAMYVITFKKKIIRTVIIAPTIMVFVFCYLLGKLIG